MELIRRCSKDCISQRILNCVRSRYPIISINLKSVGASSHKEAVDQLVDVINREAFRFMLTSTMYHYKKPICRAITTRWYFLSSLFGNVLKTNESLAFAVLTGCLRIAKESIFTGLNNFSVYSITDEDFDESFGFTDNEVREMLCYYGLRLINL